MRLSPFNLHRPTTVDEASRLLAELGPDALPYCGGTELLLVTKLGLTEFSDLVDLKGIEELQGIQANGGLRIGAAVTHREIERSPIVRAGWPSLAEMERHVGNIRVRSVGTIGGNLCFADPHSDPATFLIAAGGTVSARGARSMAREIPMEDFTRGPYETALEEGELLLAVNVPPPPAAGALVHRKMSFHERPAITVAARIELAAGSIGSARLAVGSIGVAAQRLPEAEQALIGASVTGLDSRECAEAAAHEAEPVEDSNGSVEYKRQLVRVLVARAVSDVVARAA
jgi:carbon-monoxide dehydrogenase medium subunit